MTDKYRNRANNSTFGLKRIQQHKNVNSTDTIPIHVTHSKTRRHISRARSIFVQLTPVMFYN